MKWNINTTSTTSGAYILIGGDYLIVEEYKNEEATIRFHDDYILSKEESLQTLEKIADKVLRNLAVTTKEETA